mgnify:CR=1 FL=1
MLEINKDFLDSLFAKAKENPRLRQNYGKPPIQRKVG